MARPSSVPRQVAAAGLIMACAQSPAFALQLGPSASIATPFGAGATVESLFSTEELEAHLGQGHVHVAATCVLPDGDVVVGLQVGFAGAALVHWEAQDGALTTIAREFELGTAMGGYQGGALSIHALDATAPGANALPGRVLRVTPLGL